MLRDDGDPTVQSDREGADCSDCRSEWLCVCRSQVWCHQRRREFRHLAELVLWVALHGSVCSPLRGNPNHRASLGLPWEGDLPVCFVHTRDPIQISDPRWLRGRAENSVKGFLNLSLPPSPLSHCSVCVCVCMCVWLPACTRKLLGLVRQGLCTSVFGRVAELRGRDYFSVCVCVYVCVCVCVSSL